MCHDVVGFGLVLICEQITKRYRHNNTASDDSRRGGYLEQHADYCANHGAKDDKKNDKSKFLLFF